MDIVPDIAASWEESPDGKTYTFHLRPGVTFSNGREIEAADFKYSWERACDPDTGSGTAATYLGDIVGARDMLAGTVEEISGVEVVDDYTLRVTIDAPKAYFLSKLAYPTAFVVDRAKVESGPDWWRDPDGTGPFELQEWETGQWLVLRRSQTYHGEPARVEQVVYILAGPPMPMYELGQIDVAPVYGSYIYRARDESGPFYSQLSVTPELSLDYIGFNTAQSPFDDVNVRLAFCHAVDKESITRVILRDMVSGAGGILPPGMPGYNESLEGIDYDVEKAKQLIAMSKYEDVSNLPPITLTVTGYGNYIPDQLGAIVQGWQQNLGVEVSVRQLEPEDFIYNLKEEKDEMFALAWIADYPDPHNFLDVLFYTGSENNAFEYSNPDLDALLDNAAVEQDNAARLAMYQQAEQIVLDDAPCIPLWHGANYILVRPYVRNYELSLLGIPDLSQVSVENP
jgi:oligopeptide transport system substrate-binding protein